MRMDELGNQASGEEASVTGGLLNKAGGKFSAVSGGSEGQASGVQASVSRAWWIRQVGMRWPPRRQRRRAV